jgi:NAD(P)-dependent dehydrogenase (short-subunit alcohol dehydrogenase family)
MGLEIFSLKGRTAIVTGGSKGLGEAIALSMADAGANLVITGRDEASLDKVAAAVGAKGSKCIPMKIDVLKK